MDIQLRPYPPEDTDTKLHMPPIYKLGVATILERKLGRGNIPPPSWRRKLKKYYLNTFSRWWPLLPFNVMR